MGESQGHLELVGLILRYVAWRLRVYPAVAIFADLPTTPRNDKPPRLGGFVPDVFATDVPTTVRVVGEAKTAEDLESPHTLLQLAAFFEHLRLFGGILVLAVPRSARATACCLVDRITASASVDNVETVILDDTSQWP